MNLVTNRHNWMARWAASFASLFFIGSTFGQSLNISVSSAQYTTYVEAYSSTPTTNNPPISRTTTSLSPLRDEIDVLYMPYGTTNHAIASAGLFQVSDQTGLGFANASATSQLWFSSLVDQNQAVGIQISNFQSPYTAGSISLLDLTSNSELWSYSWSMGFTTNNIPWSAGGQGAANFNVDTVLQASHQYELTMMTASQAGNDTENVDVQLTGLQVVPEPSSVGLLLIPLLGFGARPACGRMARGLRLRKSNFRTNSSSRGQGM